MAPTTSGRKGEQRLERILVGCWLTATALGAVPPLGAQAELLSDINTAGIASAGFQNLSEEVAVLNDQLYVFIADDTVTGREPWVFDLTTGTAEQLADIYPGPSNSSPRNFVTIGTSLLFVATDPTHGEELWVTDGTPAGTVLVEDIMPGAASSGIYELYPVPGDRAVFRANDGIAGIELWVSDGSAGGTFLLADIAPGGAHSTPTAFAWAGGRLLFRANDGSNGYELWKWEAGSANLVADIEPGAGGSSPYHLYPLGALVVFQACRTTDGCELWRSDGTSAGTFLAHDLNPTGSSYPYGFFWHAGLARLFFNADDGVHGHELWQRMGGVATRLTDLNPGSEDSDPTALGELATKLTFVADDGGGGSSLFAYDGVSTTLLKSLSTAGVPGDADHAVAWNSRVYFLEGSSGCWYTDGTAGGTVKWTTCSSSHAFTVGDGRLLYGDYEDGEREVWSIDASDTLAQETDFASYSSSPEDFTWLGSTAFFSADDAVSGRELWVSDGTPGATTLIDLEPGADASDPDDFQVFAGAMWFEADTAATGSELWHSDGTPGGTVAYELSPGTSSSYPSDLAVLGSHLFVAAYDDVLDAQLFRIADAGSPPQVLPYAGEPDLYPEELTPSGNKLFFFGESPATGRELFVIEETGAAPTPLEVIPGTEAPNPLEQLVAWNGAVYFIADDDINGPQVWRSDGLTVAPVTALTSGYWPDDLTAGPGGVYFVYDEPSFGNEIWRTDGITTMRITDVAPLDDDAYPYALTAVGDRLYFTADDDTTGDELWWTDGVTVSQLADLQPGANGSDPGELTPAGDRLVFAADNGNGRELWITDGVDAHPLPEVWPGIGASNPTEVAVDPAATRILLSAIGPGTWREPYRIDLLLFADGFETGNPSLWSATVP